MAQKENIIPSGNDKKINIIDSLRKFIECTKSPITKELLEKNEKYIYFLYAYAEQTMKIYMDNYNKKAYIIPRRNLLYIKKFFIKNNIGEYKYKNLSLYDIHSEKIFIFLIIYSFIIFVEVIKCKDKNSNRINENNKKLKLLNHLLFKYIHIVGNFYSSKVFEEEHLEIFFKFLIILSTSSTSSKPANKNDNIANTIFLVQCIKGIKMIFNKIYLSKNVYNEKQEQLMNNIF